MPNMFLGFPVSRAKIAEMIEGEAAPKEHHEDHELGGDDEIDCTGLEGAGGGNGGVAVVDRGDPSGWDFTAGNFTCDNTWRDLDLSGIIPADATWAICYVCVMADTAGLTIRFREKGNSNAYNVFTARVTEADKPDYYEMWIKLDSNRVIQYEGDSDTWNTIRFLVRGWTV